MLEFIGPSRYARAYNGCAMVQCVGVIAGVLPLMCHSHAQFSPSPLVFYEPSPCRKVSTNFLIRYIATILICFLIRFYLKDRKFVNTLSINYLILNFNYVGVISFLLVLKIIVIILNFLSHIEKKRKDKRGSAGFQDSSQFFGKLSYRLNNYII